jgi:hypothetical protein
MTPFHNIELRGKVIELDYDVVVVGGGLAGVCAAIAAARHGCSTALIQDRPVLGGNSSSEIRIHASGANDGGAWARETGIIEELTVEERARNHDVFVDGWINSIWDMVLYEWTKKEQGLTVYLNTRAFGIAMANARTISSVVCAQLGSDRIYKLRGSYFIDCTGDGTVGALAGAEYRFGRESRYEFGEPFAPEQADKMTQGTTLLFRAIDTGRFAPFTPPPWAEEYPTEESLYYRVHEPRNIVRGGKEYAGYWWIEVAPPFDTVDQNEEIRDELLRHIFGVWDHIKNRGNHQAENMGLEWIGMVPGKRESRRLIGDYILTKNDQLKRELFPDRVAYAGYYTDIHSMGGVLARDKAPEPSHADLDLMDAGLRNYVFSIPLRCLFSKDIENLFMAGRDISQTHVALGSTRVQLTCSIMGQSVGTAAALCVKKGVIPRTLANDPILMKGLQQTLLKDDCFIIDCPSEDPADLARGAVVTASSSMPLTLEPYETPPSRLFSVFVGSGDNLLSLDMHRSQVFPVTSDEIRTLSLFLRSSLNKEATIRLELAPARDMWSFDEDSTPLKCVEVSVPAGHAGYVAFDLNMKVEPRHLYRLNVCGEPGVEWVRSKSLPGVAAAYKKPKWKTWQMLGKYGQEKIVYAMRLSPPSEPFEPANVINGVARPEKWTNIWISDPDAGFPQTLTIDFGRDVEFNKVYLTFDTFLDVDNAALPPYHKAPECVCDYALKAFCEGRWNVLAEFKGNFHRRRIHHVETMTTRNIALEVRRSNGEPTARVYEVRVYKE